MADTPSSAVATTVESSADPSSGAGPGPWPVDASPRGPGRSALERPAQGGAALNTDRGTTTIASSVVAKIAALATQEIPGVQAMGKTMARTLGSLRQKIPGAPSASTTQGVSVEVGERQAAVDIDIVAFYGQSIVETATAIRENVIDRIESMTGLEVVEVNVSVDDLYIDGDDSDSTRVE